jgi:hypothetical protein
MVGFSYLEMFINKQSKWCWVLGVELIMNYECWIMNAFPSRGGQADFWYLISDFRIKPNTFSVF